MEMRKLGSDLHVPVLSFDTLLCNAQSCAVELDGSIVYRDEGHFSHEGSIAVARRMQLGRMLDRVAR